MSYQFDNGAPAPTGLAAMNGSPAPNNRGQRIPSAAQQGQNKQRNRRKQQNVPQGPPDYSGSMSDSVTNPQSSKKTLANQRQSIAMGAIPGQQHNYAQHMGQYGQNMQKGRPASMAGPMLPATPAKEQAYAGPTFQASPAASSLPMPKFFSKSVPNAAAQPSLAARMEGEKTPEQKASPEADYVSPSGAQHQSPLDMFFKADKAEKDRKRSQGGGMLSPDLAARAPPATEPRNPFAQNSRSVFLSELDGDDLPSPRTIPQTDSRPTQHRAISSPGHVPQVDGARDIEDEKDAMTRSLKAMLMSNAPPSPSNSIPHPQSPASRSASNPLGQPFGTPSPPTTRQGPPSTDPQAQHYALQYGNKNLSPLFRSSRGNGSGHDNQTPSRPSSLRQEVDSTPSAQPIPFPAFANVNGSGMSPRGSWQGQGYDHRQQQQHQQYQSTMDSNAFSRQYLDQSVRAAGVGGQYAGQGMQGANGNAGSSGNGNGGKDVSAMEDSLRRMLKLNGAS